MKTFIFFSLFVFSYFNTPAQKIKLKPSAGISGTITETGIAGIPDYRENWFVPEFTVGSFAETRVNKRFHFEAGFFYSFAKDLLKGDILICFLLYRNHRLQKRDTIFIS